VEHDSRGVLIKPPMEDVTAGRVFKPGRRFYYKEWFGAVIIWLFLWICTIGILALGSWIGASDTVSDWGPVFWVIFYDWLPAVNFWYVVSSVFWFLPILIAIPFYIRSFEYSVISKAGTTMPEIYVRKGLVNVTKKHVPFRTITNIASRAGPIDRLFGIGTVEIQTAGFSGGAQAGRSPEEKLEGITFYEQVRDFVLQELRRFRDPYVTGTEVVHPVDKPAPQLSDGLGSEILITLREIRNVLERIDNNLEKER
jgi:membrane protein YdbS with pleckstrin-like domain